MVKYLTNTRPIPNIVNQDLLRYQGIEHQRYSGVWCHFPVQTSHLHSHLKENKIKNGGTRGTYNKKGT